MKIINMKNFIRIIILYACLLVAACQGSEKQTDTTMVITNNWVTLVTDTYKGKRDSISFVNAQTGWYGTGKGDLYRTQDAGKSWQIVKSQPGTFIRAVAFLDEQTGYIGNIGTDYYPGVTDETPLYRTHDGGVTWETIDLNGKTIKGVCAIDIIEVDRIYQGNLKQRSIIHAAGRVGGTTGIIRSVDNGENWEVIDMTPHAAMILDIKFFDESVGLVFASTSTNIGDTEGLVLRTEDGGKSWEEVYKSGRKAELVWKASFPDNQHGFATIQTYDRERSTQLIIRTEDGGKTWVEKVMVEDPV